MTKAREVRRSAVLLTSGSIASLAAGLVTAPLFARLLGPEGRGTLAAALVWAMTLTPVSALGSDVATTVLVAERPSRLKTVLLNDLRAAGPFTIVLVALLWVLMPTLLHGHSDHTITLARIAVLSVPFGTAALILAGALVGAKRYTWVALERTAPVWIYTALIVLSALAGFLTVGWAVAAYIVGVLAGLVVTGVALLQARRQRGGAAREPAGFRHQAAMGLRAWWGQVMNLANTRLDQLLLVPLVSARQLGFYVVAVSVSTVARIGPVAINTMVIARVAESERLDRRRLIGRALRFTLITVGVVSLPLLLLAHPVVAIVLGNRFLPMVPMLQVLLVAMIGFALGETASACLAACRRVGAVSLVGAFGTALTVVGLVAFLPGFGAIAAAWVSLVAYWTGAIAQYYLLRREVGLQLGDLIVRRKDLLYLFDLALGRRHLADDADA